MKKQHYEINKVQNRLWGLSGVLASYGPRDIGWWRRNFYALENFGDRHRVMNEKRQNRNARKDEEIQHYKVKLRSRRMNVPTKWDDEHISKWGGKSWKLGTKARKQWAKNVRH
jgi:hypothetical protein